MKICQITPYFYPVLGGVETVVEQYARNLTRLNHEVTILTSVEEIRKKIEFDVIEFKQFAHLKGSYMPISFDFLAKLGSIKADIYHLHANKRFITDIGAAYLKSKKKKFVFSPHAGQFGTSFLGKLHNAILGPLSFSADLVVCVSEFEKQLIESNGIRLKKVSVLPNGVDLAEFKNLQKGFFTSYGWKDNQVIMYAGRLTEHKKIDTLIYAFNALNTRDNLRLAIIGPDGGERTKLEKLIRELELENKVKFFGTISRENLLNAYSSADVFCLPSVSEAFGLVLIEAMAAGTAVIGADKCSIPEIIKDNKNGLLFDGTAEDLTEKIKYLLENKKVAGTLSAQALHDVREQYDWLKIVDRLSCLYQDII